jgi:type I restriction enzyme S subunit
MILAHTFPVATTRVQATINQDMKALLVREGSLPEYLHWLLVSNASQILSLVSTAGHGTKRLETDALLSLPIAVPPKSRQEDFAAHVADIRALESTQAVSRERLDGLFQSLLHRAFQGDL